MDGLLIVNKVAGYTSHDIVNKVRKIFKTRQVGHTGTLDPMASGVLVICLNQATKLVPYLESATKTYCCEMMIGLETDTFDISGNITEEDDTLITEEIIDKTLLTFLGSSKQVPPIYSAIKINGKKLYEYARKNEEISIPPRDIFIYEIKRTSEIYNKLNHQCFTFEVTVSKGTYIRSICHDFGEKINIPCTMSGLNRTRCGKFTISDAFSIEEIENGNYQIISMLDSLSEYPQVNDDDCVKKAENGMKISPYKIQALLSEFPSKFVISKDDLLIAIYEYDETSNTYKASRVWKY